MARIYLTILFILHLALVAEAQFNEGQRASDRLYQRGVELYESGSFGPARSLFEQYEHQFPDGSQSMQVSLHKVLAALNAGHADAEKLANAYLLNNNSFAGHQVTTVLGVFHFNNKDYDKAAQYFQKSKENISDDGVVFKLGYAYFKTNKDEEALQAFKKVGASNSSLAQDANYYAGFILFNQGKYEQALIYLNRVSEEGSYSIQVKSLLADIYAKQGNAEMLLEIAEKTKESEPNAAQIYLLAGDMYFYKKNYQKALQYFEKGNKKSLSAATNLNYKLGIAYDELGQTPKAIESFKQAALTKDSTGQYATYKLGELYTKDDNLNFAASAFYTASRMDFVTEVRRDALFQLAKVNFTLGKYKEAIDGFTEFSSKYPKDKGIDEANELISKAFLLSSNYDQAISYIEKISNKNQMIRTTYQRVCFLKGTQLYNQSQFFQAVQYFNKSLENPIDKELVLSANYWKAEAYSIGKQFDDAIKAYAVVLGRDARSSYGHKSQYGIAYAHYNAKRYREALPYFRQFINNDGKNTLSKELKVDAMLRLADCFFAEKQYDNAVEGYQAAISQDDRQRDYALYQMCMAYQLSNKGREAQAQFDVITANFPQSVYADDAYFQSAQIDFEAGNYVAAVSKFSTVINNFPTGSLTPYAYLRRALANNNLGDKDKTEKDYIKLLTDFPTHPMANSAILGLQEVMIANGKTAEFEQYLIAFKRANPESTNLESLDFEAAKSHYFSQNYTLALTRMQEFLQKYPKSQYTEEVNFYMADAHFRQNNFDLSRNAYQTILVNPGSPYYLRSIARVASMELARRKYPDAIRFFHVLRSNARSNRDRSDAFLGLMESYFHLNRYDSTDYFANQIISLGGSSFNAQSKAYLYLGKAALAQKRYDDAMDNFINSLNTAKDEIGAEAQYNLALVHFERKNYRQSINALYDLNNNFAQYDYWLGKSFLMIADNFVALNELLQAEATLNSLIENSPNEEIKREARAKKAQFEQSDNQKQVAKDTLN